jgi:hypothetical protein
MNLGEWIVQQVFSTAAPLIGKIKPETLSNYISVIRSYYIDLGHLIAAFKDYTIKRALARAISLFPSTKKSKLLIIKDILDKIVTFSPCKADININAVFMMAFTGFLYIGEIIYPNRKAKDFSIIKALYSDVRIAPNSHLIVFYLKWSKIDKTYSGINIQIATILGDYLCPIAAIIQLFNYDPWPLSDPLFSVNNKAFLVLVVYKILLICLAASSILPNSYSNHSFCRGAAQYIYNYSFTKS